MLDVIAWNVYIGNDPADVGDTVARWLRDPAPEVVLLFEATHCSRVLAHAAASYGYVHHQGADGQAAGIAVLLRDDIEVLRHREVAMRSWWRGPIHGWRQRPRVYPVLRLRVGGRVVRLMACHFPTGGPASAAAQESIRRVRHWLRAGLPSVPAVAVGDLNLGPRMLRSLFPRHHVVAGHGADNLVGRGLTGTAQLLGKHGSDHEAVHYTLRSIR